jgi:DNA-binding beta-propeller fold protein YncE
MALVCPDGSQLFVPAAVSNGTSESGPGYLAIIDAETRKVTARISIGTVRTVPIGAEPWMLLLNATGSTMYVANR